MISDLHVSVVLPTRNRADLLPDAIQSLLDQVYPPDLFEIVIVNDGSTDETEEVALRFQKSHDPRIRYVPRSHSGLNASRNAGIAEASGDLIAFVDDDIVASPDWLSSLVDGTRRHPTAGCFAGRILLQLEGPLPRTCGRESVGESELDLGDEERQTDWGWGANFSVTRQALNDIGMFNESLPLYGDETEWQYRLRKAGGKIIYLPGARVRHRRKKEDLKPRAMLRRRY